MIRAHIAHMFMLQLLTAHEGFSRYMYKAHNSRVMLLIYPLKPKGAVNNWLLALFVHALQCVAMSVVCLFVNAAVFRRLHCSLASIQLLSYL